MGALDFDPDRDLLGGTAPVQRGASLPALFLSIAQCSAVATGGPILRKPVGIRPITLDDVGPRTEERHTARAGIGPQIAHELIASRKTQDVRAREPKPSAKKGGIARLELRCTVERTTGIAMDDERKIQIGVQRSTAPRTNRMLPAKNQRIRLQPLSHVQRRVQRRLTRECALLE